MSNQQEQFDSVMIDEVKALGPCCRLEKHHLQWSVQLCISQQKTWLAMCLIMAIMLVESLLRFTDIPLQTILEEQAQIIYRKPTFLSHMGTKRIFT